MTHDDDDDDEGIKKHTSQKSTRLTQYHARSGSPYTFSELSVCLHFYYPEKVLKTKEKIYVHRENAENVSVFSRIISQAWNYT